MHSRIFQISKNPIDEDSYLEESRYYDNFVGGIADYVDTIGYPDEDYKWLGGMKGITVDPDKKTLTIDSKVEYFKKKYETFIKQTDDLSHLSIDDFITNKADYDIYIAANTYEEKYEFYVDDDGEYFGLVSLDHLLRSSKDGDMYHLGAVFDYHY